MWRYYPLLPIADTDAVVSLGEGGTPLLRSTVHPAAEVYLKDETRNPTGSHKDRQVCVAINHARSLGRTTSVLVSSGSTGIANAAYCARAGMRSIVFMAEGVPADRVYPVYALGSTVVEVRGQVDALIARLNELAVQRGLYHSSTARICNPYQAEGAKTIAFEIVEDLGRVPDWVVVPLGGGGTLAAMWRAFSELSDRSMIGRLPRMAGVTPRSFNALERALDLGYRTGAPLGSPPAQ
jgi:threonine synthase